MPALLLLYRERETVYHADDYPAESIQTAPSGHQIVYSPKSLGKDDLLHSISSCTTTTTAIVVSLPGRFA
jgi:hypothetical protein